MNLAPSELTREFPLAAQYRRSAWYAALGTVAAVAVAGFVRRIGFVPGGPVGPSFFLGASAFFLAGLGLLIVAHRWRLRVDQNGLARRRLLKWDVWTWKEFQTGKIKTLRNALRSTRRSPWRNTIALSLLEENDQAFVLGVCKAFYQPDEEQAVALPDGELALRYQLFSKLTFRGDGVLSSDPKGELTLSWVEVDQVRLIYDEHWTGQLRGIEVDLPNRTLKVAGINEISGPGIETQRISTDGALPKVVNVFVAGCVPPEKLARLALHGPPETFWECEYRMEKHVRELRKANRYYRTVPLGCLILTAACLGPRIAAAWRAPAAFPNAGWLVLATLLGVVTLILFPPLMYWALLREIRNRHVKSLRELENWKSEQLQQPAPHSPCTARNKTSLPEGQALVPGSSDEFGG